MTLIKSEVVKNDEKVVHVCVEIGGEATEIYSEIRGILESFEKDPELSELLIKALEELLEKAKENN